MDAPMALELFPGALHGISGRFSKTGFPNISEEELAEFETAFPYKKRVAESQKKFAERAGHGFRCAGFGFVRMEK